MSRWVDFVKDFAKRRGITYGCALSDPDASQEYRYKYKEGKLSTEQKKAIKPIPRPKMSDFYEAKEEIVEGESPMFEPKVKRRGRPKGSKNKPKTEGKGIIEDLAKRERGQITTDALLAERDRARIAEVEARLERMNAMVGNSPRPTAKGGRKTLFDRK